MKAFRDKKGTIRLFRPQLNLTRLRHSARRLTLPDFNSDEALKLLVDLLKVDKSWVPNKD